MNIEAGTNEFGVAYLRAQAGAVSSEVPTGSITWDPVEVFIGSETIIEFEGVPEPSRALLLLTGVAAMGLRRRRKVRS